MFCWKCGAKNPEEADFCLKCGANLRKMKEVEEGYVAAEENWSAAGSNVQSYSSDGNKKNSKKKAIWVSVFLVAAVVAVVICLMLFSTGNNIEIGDIVTFGTYEQDGNTVNGPELIEWIVLGKHNGHTLLLSRYALDCQQYNEEDEDITWADCTLRKWLNDDFYNIAFSAADKARIVTAHNENPDSYELYRQWDGNYGAEGGSATDDMVFLLSWTEAQDYFSGKLYDSALEDLVNYNQMLLCKPTVHAEKQGVWTFSNSDNEYPAEATGCCWWWLRSPGYYQNNATDVSYHGMLDSHYVYVRTAGVRPAILID